MNGVDEELIQGFQRGIKETAIGEMRDIFEREPIVYRNFAACFKRANETESFLDGTDENVFDIYLTQLSKSRIYSEKTNSVFNNLSYAYGKNTLMEAAKEIAIEDSII
jgi:hypothetical protein